MPHAKNIFGLLEQLQSPDITVHQNRCANVRNRNAKCMRCAEVCTSGCISCSDEGLIISPERCIGCGTCATVCPTCALEARHPCDAELLRMCIQAMSAADDEVIISCERILEAKSGAYDTEKVVGVTCLGRVEESLIVTLVVAGAKHISLVQGSCETCEHSTGHRMCELVCETANTLLETWKSDVRANMVRKLPRTVRKADCKRGYDDKADITTQDAANETPSGQGTSESHFQSVMEDGTLPHFVPDRRELLLNSLASLGEPKDELIETRLWGHVVIDSDKCMSCQMCATFCPTGAITKFKEEDGTFGIEHYPVDCVKCRCCTDICPTDALTLSDEVYAVDLLSSACERYEMKPMKHAINNPHKTWHIMKDLLGCNRVYER